MKSGTLFYAFPLLYASSFSGFYLPLNIVLWLLILRALGIEFRAHLSADLWRDFFDAMFCFSSALLAIFFGAAFGNVVRGVALAPDHYFFAPLWTNFRVGRQPGVLDWYTVLSALVALAALMHHGALYVAMKTVGALQERMRRIAAILWPVVVLLTIVSLFASLWIRPELTDNYMANPLGWFIPVLVIGSIGAIWYYRRIGRDAHAFFASCAYLVAMLAGAAFALYPQLLPATTGSQNSLTIYNTASGAASLTIGLIWWTIGMIIAIGYFVLVYTMFRGKVTTPGDHY